MLQPQRLESVVNMSNMFIDIVKHVSVTLIRLPGAKLRELFCPHLRWICLHDFENRYDFAQWYDPKVETPYQCRRCGKLKVFPLGQEPVNCDTYYGIKK